MLSVFRPFGSPASSLFHVDREVERLFHDNTRGFDAPAEVVESEQGLALSVDLPGVADGDLQVTVEQNVLTVRATRRPLAVEGAARRSSERGYGAVTRSFRLPSWADAGAAEARLDRGVLTLAIPRRAESRPRTVEVKVNASS